jgi:predicted nucleic acid-binding protein
MHAALFADASYYIAFLNRPDSDRNRAIAWQRYVTKNRIPVVTTEAVLWELLNFFAGAGRSRAYEAYARLHLDPLVRVFGLDDPLHAVAVRLYRDRPDQEWGITDCLSFEVMRRQRLTGALTFDHHFEQAGFRVLLLEEPPT